MWNGKTTRKNLGKLNRSHLEKEKKSEATFSIRAKVGVASKNGKIGDESTMEGWEIMR